MKIQKQHEPASGAGWLPSELVAAAANVAALAPAALLSGRLDDSGCVSRRKVVVFDTPMLSLFLLVAALGASSKQKVNPVEKVSARWLLLLLDPSTPERHAAHLGDLYTESGQTLHGSFSAVSKPNFASKYAFESSRRDLHNALHDLNFLSTFH